MAPFYKFRFAQKRGEIFIESLNEYEEQDLKTGRFVPNSPFVVKVSEGKKLYDIVRFQDPFNFAISERTHNLLKDAELSGWDSYEIAIEGKNEKYYGFQVIGKCGILDMPKEEGFYTGYKFDYDTWDKSDFFSPAETMLLFCTQRVQELFKKHKITNAELIDIKTVQAYSVGS